MSEKTYEIRDPIHGLVPYNDLEREIINSFPFQRLRRIRQLAWTDYIYPGAMHTRFEHSIGVMHIAGRVFDALFKDRRNKEIAENVFGLNSDERERRKQLVRLAALTHDLGHGPFSHPAEDLFPDDDSVAGERHKISHEEYSAWTIKGFIDDILKSHKTGNRLAIDGSLVASYIVGAPTDSGDALLKDIISGTIDVDRMDYLLRDSYHCGVRYGQYDLERIINTIAICEDDELEGEFSIGINEDGIHAAEGLFIARFMMFTQVYMHKTRSIYDYHFENLMRDLLHESGGVFPGPRDLASLKQFLNWDDWRVLGCLSEGKGGIHGEIIRNRHHHRLVYQTNEVFDGEGEEERAQKRFERVEAATKNLGCIRRVASKSWYSQSVKSNILVRPSDGDSAKGNPLSRISAVVKSLRPVRQLRLYVPLANVDSATDEIKAILARGGRNGKA